MSKEKVSRIFRSTVEHAAPPAEIGIWPALQARMAATTSERPPHPLRTMPRMALLVSAVLVVASGLVLTTTPGRAFGQTIWRFFTQSDAASAAPVAVVDGTEGTPRSFTPTSLSIARLPFEDDCGPVAAPRCSPSDLRERVRFPISVLVTKPRGITLVGLTGGPEQIWSTYTDEPHTGGLLLIEGRADLAWANPIVDSATVVQRVLIGNDEGEIVEGAWQDGVSGLAWNSAAALLTLRWEHDHRLYTLCSFGEGWTSEDLVAAATGLERADLQTQPLVGRSMLATDVSAIEAQSGFRVVTPESLFPDYVFMGYTYAANTASVCLHYGYAPLALEFQPVAYLVESPTRELRPSAGDALRRIDLPGADQGEGWLDILYGDATIPCEDAPFHGGPRLSWRLEGMTYQLYASTNPADLGFVSEDQMIATAKSLTGSPYLSWSIDPTVVP